MPSTFAGLSPDNDQEIGLELLQNNQKTAGATSFLNNKNQIHEIKDKKNIQEPAVKKRD